MHWEALALTFLAFSSRSSIHVKEKHDDNAPDRSAADRWRIARAVYFVGVAT
jgi:hypothetical protein